MQSSPTKSSLLQVFVSVSGLVLVRSPYHCEPAFAKLEGTREGKVNSYVHSRTGRTPWLTPTTRRLYSEKAYVLSRSFVRTALDRPPAGLENEIKHFYLKKGRLQSVIDHARRLMEKGEADAADLSAGGEKMEEENAEMWNADAMGSLTMGAIITLRVSPAERAREIGQQFVRVFDFCSSGRSLRWRRS
jgi:ubiquitin-conjugating enzyme E2 O